MKKILLFVFCLLFVLTILPKDLLAEENLLGPYDNVYEYKSMNGYWYYEYQLGDDYYIVVNEEKFGPYDQVSIHHKNYGWVIEYQKNDKEYIIYNNKTYGPFDEIVQYDFVEEGKNGVFIEDGEFSVLYKQDNEFYIENKSSKLGPVNYDVDNREYPIKNIFSKGEKWWIYNSIGMGGSQESQGYSIGFISINNKKYGSYRSVYNVFNNSYHWGFLYSAGAKNGFIIDGTDYDPLGVYSFHRTGADKWGWWAAYYDKKNTDKENREYWLAVNGEERGPYKNYKEAMYNITYDMDIVKDKETYKVFSKGKEYGPYDVVYNYECGTYRDEKRNLDYPLHSFCYKNNNQEGCMVEGVDYGGYDEVVSSRIMRKFSADTDYCFRLIESDNSKQWGFVAKKDSNFYAVVNGEQYGPYDDVRDLEVDNNNWAFGYSLNDNFYLIHNGDTYSLGLSVDDAEKWRMGIFHSKKIHSVEDYSENYEVGKPGECNIEFKKGGAYLQYEVDNKDYYFLKGEKFELGLPRVFPESSDPWRKDKINSSVEVIEKTDGKNVLVIDKGYQITEIKDSELNTPIIDNEKMFNRLQGKIILKVEDAGRAYYVHPQTKKMHFLGRPNDAFMVMWNQGIGISNTDLDRIPESGGDFKNNTDRDFANKQKGKIFLQIENNGEAWYINPSDSKKYFLGRPDDSFRVMRELGLGISNNDFDSL